MKSEKVFLVKESTLLHLLEKKLFLDYLETMGVDNWCGFGEGMSEYLAEQVPNIEKEIDFKDLAKIKLLDNFKEYISEDDDLK